MYKILVACMCVCMYSVMFDLNLIKNTYIKQIIK